MLIFTTIFFSNYALRPYTLSICLFLLGGMGWVNGFVTARVLKFFGSVDWCFSAFIAAIMFPCWLLFTLGFIDLIEYIAEIGPVVSSIPFSSTFFYCICWLALTVPLCFHGAYMGFKVK